MFGQIRKEDQIEALGVTYSMPERQTEDHHRLLRLITLREVRVYVCLCVISEYLTHPPMFHS